MAERFRLTPEDEVRRKYRKTGVVVFVFNEEDNVLLLRENTSNQATGKEAGKYGVLCETSRERERWEETVIRAFREELGMGEKNINETLRIAPKNCFLGEKLFVPGVLARTCAVNWAGRADRIFDFRGDGEVEIVGWEKLVNLMTYPLRTGVENVLKQCLEEGVFQKTWTPEELVPISIGSLGMATE
ncbi:MAG: hypothetical protein UX17_C0054G0010 [Parcubacteria group bacterium GW2011_GWC2_45_7]|nr:MAG: hypothetical protein UX17_C0054G0010 [Parcubacteria group bacterium GW2011_GWC2_45_7]